MRCGSCKFWQQSEQDFGKGECRRNVPLVLIVQGANMAGQAITQRVSYWPSVGAGEWCGEFSQRFGAA